MSAQSDLPPVDEYPGYFSGKPRFFRRRKVQVFGAGVVGIVVGTLLGSGESATSSVPDPGVPERQVQARISQAVDSAVDDAVEEAESELEQDVDAAEERAAEAQSELRAAEKQLKRARAETRRVRSAAKASQRRAVAAAVARTRSEMQQSAPAPQPRSNAGGGGGGGTDPQFSYCYEANDAGYGNYQQGVDPEYDWYTDADGDGWVCEF